MIPSTIVLDRSHRVAAVFLRALLAEDLEPVVRRLAAETASGSGPRGERRPRLGSTSPWAAYTRARQCDSMVGGTVIGQVVLPTSPPTIWAMLGWLPPPVPLLPVLAMVLAVWYVLAVRVVRSRGRQWAWTRTASFLGGCIAWRR